MSFAKLATNSFALSCPSIWLYLLFWSASISGSLIAYDAAEANARLVFQAFAFVGATVSFLLLNKWSRSISPYGLLPLASLLTFVLLFGHGFGCPAIVFYASLALLGLLHSLVLVQVLLQAEKDGFLCLSLSIGIAAVLEGGLSELVRAVGSDSLTSTVLVALPIACLLCLLLGDRLLNNAASSSETEGSPARGVCGALPTKLVAPFTVLAFGMGVSFNLFQVLCYAGDPFANYHNGLGMVAAGVLLVVCVKAVDIRKSMTGVLIALFAFEAMCFLTASIWDSSPRGFYLLAMLAFTFFYYYSFVLGKSLFEEGKFAFPLLLAVMEGAYLLAQLVSVFVYSLNGSNTVVLVALYVFFIVACVAIPWLVVVQRRGLESGDALLHNDSQAIRDNLVDRFNLSSREAELLELLGMGYRASEIAEKLYISRETARTHIKNIYKKMDVHSQREIIDLFHDNRS